MSDIDGLAPREHEQLVYTLETRFAPHLEAAASVVRDAEAALDEARERVAAAERAVADATYVSDPRPFMRQGVDEEVEGLERKTTAKKVRASYRFLLDRSVELAAAEVQGFHDDQAALARDREESVEACRVAEARAVAALEAALKTQERVQAAERAARQGLDVMLDKLSN